MMICTLRVVRGVCQITLAGEFVCYFLRVDNDTCLMVVLLLALFALCSGFYHMRSLFRNHLHSVFHY